VKASEWKKHPVVSLGDGVKVGEVADLSLDSTYLQLRANLLTGHDGTSLIPFIAVRNMGPDALPSTALGSFRHRQRRKGSPNGGLAR
jgi:hypothetical protein